MSAPKTPAQPEAVNERNWYQKVNAAYTAYGGQWRKQFTPEELEIIDREEEAEYRWAQRARKYDLPGPTRIDWMD